MYFDNNKWPVIQPSPLQSASRQYAGQATSKMLIGIAEVCALTCGSQYQIQGVSPNGEQQQWLRRSWPRYQRSEEFEG